MNKIEFQKYVIAEAKKYLFSTENEVPANSPIQESTEADSSSEEKLTPGQIKKLAEEIKKINKTIDLRNPLISESNESLVETILNENKPGRERQLDVDGINKSKHVSFQNEGEKDKWNRMLKYNVPNDEERP
jgi:hypothetical protein